MIRLFIFKIISFYQIFISPALGENCRFFPNCSEYLHKVIEKYGLAKGLLLGGKRVLKCFLWNPGGIDLP